MRGRGAILLAIAILLAALPAEAAIDIRDSAGKPVEGAAVECVEGTCLAGAPGFLPWIGLEPPPSPPYRVTLFRPGAFRGRVTSEGRALPDVPLAFRRPKAAELPVSARSGAGGLFRAPDLGPGLWEIEASSAGYLPSRLAAGLREGEERWIEVRLVPAATLEARISGPDGKPLAGVEASVRAEGADARHLSDEEKERAGKLRAYGREGGVYRLGPLARGTRYRVVFRAPGFATRSLVVAPAEETVRRELRMQVSGAIRLSVRDAEGRPVAGALGALHSDDAPDADLVPAPAPSGAEGGLLAEGLTPGTWAVRVRAPGFRPGTVRGILVAEGKNVPAGEIRLEPGFEVAGTVREEGAGPILGAEVKAGFFEEGRRLVAEARTDGEGRFRIEGLPEGKITIDVSADRFVPLRRQETIAGDESLDYVLSRAAVLAGVVLDAETGLPVPEFQVKALEEGREGEERRRGEKEREETFRDAEGRFQMEGLSGGTWTLDVRARGWCPTRKAGVEARPSEPVPVEFRLDRGLALEGTVLDAVDGRPVEGATVNAPDAEPVRTDGEGRFRLEGLRGPSRVAADHPRYIPAVVPEADPARATAISIRLERGGAVEGIVYRAGEPYPGAAVSLVGGDSARTSVSGPDGRYRLDGLAPGTHALGKTDAPGTVAGFESALVTVKAGETTRKDFGLGVTVRGRITRSGRPASGALVTFTEGGTDRPSGVPLQGKGTGRCAEDGSFEAHGLEAGLYGVKVIWADLKVGKILRIPQGVTETRFDLDIPDLWLSGKVIDSQSGTPLRAFVHASPAEQSGMKYGFSSYWETDDGESVEFSTQPSSEAEAGADGQFRVQLSGPGKWVVTAWAKGYRLEKNLELSVDSPRNDLILPLLPAINLRLTLTDRATGGPLSGNACGSVIRSGKFSMVHCGGERSFEFGSIEEGPAVVSGRAEGYAPAWKGVVISPESQEFALALGRGGVLRILVPPGAGPDEASLRKAGLRVSDSEGMDVLQMYGGPDEPLDPAGEGEFVLANTPPGVFKVSIGGGETGVPLRQREVTVAEGGEAVADLR